MPFWRKKPDESSQVYSLLKHAQAGDADARNEFISMYTPFVLKIASQASKRYIERGRDDEYSIALLAMNEAIDHFDLSRRANFFSFAETIIRRRLIDYFRTQKSQQRDVPWTQFDVVDDEDNVINYVEVASSVDAHHQAAEQEARKLEIQEYAKSLTEFGLTFADLVEVSPKHVDARKTAIDIAREVYRDPEMRQYVLERKTLPLKQLSERVSVSRKTIERQRKYILAVLVLLHGDFQQLQSYLASPSEVV